jgi:hypothetical protein
MRFSLRATDGGFLADEHAVGFSFDAVDDAGAKHYLNLQRQPEDWPPHEDWGIHLEFDGQGYGGYGCLGACRVDREWLSIDLCKPLGPTPMAEVEGFDVSLVEIDDEKYRELIYGLPRAFRDFEGLLSIA